jgi:hypothetical protein
MTGGPPPPDQSTHSAPMVMLERPVIPSGQPTPSWRARPAGTPRGGVENAEARPAVCINAGYAAAGRASAKYVAAARSSRPFFGHRRLWLNGRYNEKAQVQWADGTTVLHSNIDTTPEQGKTRTPIVTWSALCTPSMGAN